MRELRCKSISRLVDIHSEVQIEREFRDEVAILYPSNLSTFTAHDFCQAITTLLDDRERRIVANMRDARYIDSSGINALVWANRQVIVIAREPLRIASINEQVRRVLTLSSAIENLDIYEDELQALESFAF